MKLNQEEDNVEVQNVGQSKDFELQVTDKAFQILSNGIYSDKILAIVRELIANAFDAHTEAGTENVPFDVFLPTSLSPYFCVKDYGTGLSMEKVFDLYTTYFESTKNNTNDSVGAFGLGSKSPFSYTSQFTITSRYNGKKYFFAAFLNRKHIPEVTLLGEEDTDEHNGLEVTVPVNEQKDFQKFDSKTHRVLSRCKQVPNIYKSSKEFEPVEYDIEGDFYGVMNLRKDGPVCTQPRFGFNFKDQEESEKFSAIMGGIPYPIKNSDLFNTLEREVSNELSIALMDCEFNLDIYFDIGEVDIAVSRETLSFDEKTTEAVKNKIKKAVTEIKEKIEQEVQDSETWFEAYKTLTQKGKYFGVKRHAIENFYWRGQSLHPVLWINNMKNGNIIFEDLVKPDIEDGVLRIHDSNAIHLVRDTSPRLEPKPSMIFYNDLTKKEARHRLRTWIKKNGFNLREKQLYFLETKEQEVIDELLNKIPSGIETRPVSSLPQVDNNSNKKHVANIKTFKLENGIFKECNKNFEDLDGKYYIPMKNWEPLFRNSNGEVYISTMLKNTNKISIMSAENLKEFLDDLYQENVIDKVDEVYGVYPKNTKKAEDYGMVDLSEHIQNSIKNNNQLKEKLAQLNSEEKFLNDIEYKLGFYSILKTVAVEGARKFEGNREDFYIPCLVLENAVEGASQALRKDHPLNDLINTLKKVNDNTTLRIKNLKKRVSRMPKLSREEFLGQTNEKYERELLDKVDKLIYNYPCINLIVNKSSKGIFVGSTKNLTKKSKTSRHENLVLNYIQNMDELEDLKTQQKGRA